ncbi:hypothetical protein FSP39_016648 [Pinctada imbricata]|uniref:SIS domain-containing protein n=1 Tax=Pinctada imbricata TaxID=66713 RepID=A0AA88XZG7_PINIB|nr:hypothetical protein FSP39_016648 [Pinctada imbricata]
MKYMKERYPQAMFLRQDGEGGGIYHPSVLRTLEQITEVATSILKDADSGLIVFSGCGTSGRLAFMTARTFNKKLESVGKHGCFKYLIAGKDKALFTSQEAPEDDPICGKEMLQEICMNQRKVLFIGITCGLSAPYVAGQLDYCLKNLDVFTPVLLGFNPTNMARNNKIEKWNKTFSDVVSELQKAVSDGKAFILNPVVGPEPITGSSRMKSGSATKILLETIFVGAYTSSQNLTKSKWNPQNHLDIYRAICERVYSVDFSKKISHLIKLGAECLQKNGSIYYLGLDSIGIVGMIDASECPPTYSATLDDVRGFIEGGYTCFGNKEGDLKHLGKHFHISLEDFKTDIAPHLGEKDLVIILSTEGNLSQASFVQSLSCHKAVLAFKDCDIPQEKFDVVIRAQIDNDINLGSVVKDVVDGFRNMYCEMFTKWVCNAVTTGAHVMKGKVYQNSMVDLKVSNNKLYYRSVGIIQKFSNESRDESERYLLKSIYNTDNLSESHCSKTVADHIDVATPLERVVPRAMLAAILKCPISEAEKRLIQEPVIRTVISQTLNSVK